MCGPAECSETKASGVPSCTEADCHSCGERGSFALWCEEDTSEDRVILANPGLDVLYKGSGCPSTKPGGSFGTFTNAETRLSEKSGPNDMNSKRYVQKGIS